MNLIDYGRILWRRGWIILLLMLIAAGSAYLLSKAQTPIYRATQKVLFIPSRADLSVTESTSRLLSQNVEYLDSEFIAQQVIETMNLDMLPGQLKGATTVASDQFRFVIQIDVDLPDVALAGEVARQYGLALVEYRNQRNQTVRREDQIDAQLQDNPSVSLLQPRPSINAAAGAVLGFLLGAVIVFVLEYLESSIVRRREDLERGLEMPVLATIPDIEG